MILVSVCVQVNHTRCSMKGLCLCPSQLSGTIDIPSSKSLTHRAIICASLSRGRSIIRNVTFSQDIDATIAAMKELGTMIFKYDDYLEIDGTTTFLKSNCLINCKESGSTLRFMIPVSLICENNLHFIGEGQLGKRPLDPYYQIFEEQNIAYLYRENVLDLYIRGRLRGGEFKIRGDISSQFITGLLFALPLMEENSKIILTTPLESRGYIDLTLQVLRHYGVFIINNDYKEFIIFGHQMYKARDYDVEGDYSQAAFFLVANQLGSHVNITNLNPNSLQGDYRIVDIINSINDNQAINTDGKDIPDLIPIIALMATQLEGVSQIKNVSRLRLKECDRLKAIIEMINALNGKAYISDDTLMIEGKTKLKGNKVKTYHDHRMAMVASIASTLCDEEIIIDDYECVEKSYPAFFEDFKKLGGDYHECDLGD